jgi:hypothetical protein
MQMRPTFDDLKAIWLLCYARSAFIEAKRWLHEMETAQDTSHYEALVYAAVVAYCRPFTQSQVTPTKRLIPLADVLPPTYLATAHDDLLNLRDNTLATRMLCQRKATHARRTYFYWIGSDQLTD